MSNDNNLTVGRIVIHSVESAQPEVTIKGATIFTPPDQYSNEVESLKDLLAKAYFEKIELEEKLKAALADIDDLRHKLNEIYVEKLDINMQLTVTEAENKQLKGQVNNFLTYGQGGASFNEAQLIDKLYIAECERDEIKEKHQSLKTSISKFLLPLFALMREKKAKNLKTITVSQIGELIAVSHWSMPTNEIEKQLAEAALIEQERVLNEAKQQGRNQMAEQLRPYINHTNYCTVGMDGNCTCGLSAIWIAAVGEQE